MRRVTRSWVVETPLSRRTPGWEHKALDSQPDVCISEPHKPEHGSPLFSPSGKLLKRPGWRHPSPFPACTEGLMEHPRGIACGKESSCKHLSVQLGNRAMLVSKPTPEGVRTRPSWAGQLNQPQPQQPDNSPSFLVKQRKKVSRQGRGPQEQPH